MSYEAEISYRDYTIEFEYNYDPEGFLYLVSWEAFDGNNSIQIPCRVESEFIEKQLNQWLDNEYDKNCFNYAQDRLEYLGDLAYDRMMDK